MALPIWRAAKTTSPCVSRGNPPARRRRVGFGLKSCRRARCVVDQKRAMPSPSSALGMSCRRVGWNCTSREGRHAQRPCGRGHGTKDIIVNSLQRPPIHSLALFPGPPTRERMCSTTRRLGPGERCFTAKMAVRHTGKMPRCSTHLPCFRAGRRRALSPRRGHLPVASGASPWFGVPPHRRSPRRGRLKGNGMGTRPRTRSEPADVREPSSTGVESPDGLNESTR